MANGVQFEEEQQYQQPQQVGEKPFFIRLVLSTGIVSTDQQAQYVLLGVSVFLVILAFAIPSFIVGKKIQVPQSIINDAMSHGMYR